MSGGVTDPAVYAEAAGMTDEAISRATGLSWPEWVAALDARGGRDLDHAAIARIIAADWPALSLWWGQGVTVGYERAIGRRVAGQLSSGDYAASKSKTFPVPIGALFAAFADPEVRASWMGPATVRSATTDRSMRLDWPDGGLVSCWFTVKGEDKSAVSIQHERLESPERREAEKAAWAERLGTLAKRLG